MADWPKDDGTMRFWELTNPVCAAIKEIYTMKRRKHGDIKWTGPATPEFLLATALTFDERLTKEMLDYDENEQDREPLEILVGFAVQLGMEQERRMKACSTDQDIVEMSRAILRLACAKGEGQ